MSEHELKTVKVLQYAGIYDKVNVVELNTSEIPSENGQPRIRIYLNDECIFENPPFQEAAASTLEKTHKKRRQEK